MFRRWVTLPYISPAFHGSVDIGRLLIASGADVNAKRPFGAFLTYTYTALHYAASRGHLAFVELLLENEADVNAHNVQEGAFRGDNWSMTPMHAAVVGGNVAIVRALIRKGAKLDEVNYGGLRPLFYASMEGNAAIATVLLDNGANVNAGARKTFLTPSGYTALHVADRKGHLEVVKLLLDRKADPHAKDGDGNTPLAEARSNKHDQVVKLLERVGR